MRSLFFYVSAFLILMVALFGHFFDPVFLWMYVLLLPLVGMGMHNALQKKRAILRNYPILGMLRYFFEEIRPEIQQYFVENDTDGAPFSRELRSVVYQRAKKQLDTIPFGTQRDLYANGSEWAQHSLRPHHIDPASLRVKIGNHQCRQPYSASVFNISAMSYGSLSAQAIQSLNGGAKIGGFYHNTGEGGVSPYHMAEGGEICWQVGTGYFGCRNEDGSFSSEKFKERSGREQIKMIEIKLSQGAKPSHGGILPAAKVTQEIAAIRGVSMGKDVISPPSHSKFSDAEGLIRFVGELRELSGGKPVGFKICIGNPAEFASICRAIKKLEIFPDFITVDGAEGGTGAAPPEFTNSLGMPWIEGLTIVRDLLDLYQIKQNIRIITSGKVITGFHLMKALALGADTVNSARGMMLALGCIQARRCNTNHCPAGIATNNPGLTVGLVVSDKKQRVANFHANTVRAFAELMGACGVTSTSELRRSHIYKRMESGTVLSYEDLYPSVSPGKPTASRSETYMHAASPF